MEVCVVRYSVWKNAVLALIGAVFVLVQIRIGSLVDGVDWGTLLFFGAIAALFGYRTLDRRPRLVIDERGIEDCRKWVGLVPWRDIADVSIRSAGRVDFLYIKPRDPSAWLHRLPIGYRISWRLFPSWRVLSVPLQNMEVSTGVIRGVIARLAPTSAKMSN